MKLTSRAHGRLAAAAALACAVIVVPACALAAAPAALGTPAGRAAAVPAGFQPAAASFRSPASGVVLGGVACKGLVREYGAGVRRGWWARPMAARAGAS
jgi:hypothetical protein